MDLGVYVDGLQRQVALAAEAGGDETRALAERLWVPLDAAVRVTLQDAVAAAAEEITCELAPGSVELRLRGRELEFVVTPPPSPQAVEQGPGGDGPVLLPPVEGDDGGVSRINLRLPDHLKARVEHAAGREGLSVNAWLVRAAAAALERGDRERRRGSSGPKGTQHYTGWAR